MGFWGDWMAGTGWHCLNRTLTTVGAVARSSAVGDVGEAGTGLYVKSLCLSIFTVDAELKKVEDAIKTCNPFLLEK